MLEGEAAGGAGGDQFLECKCLAVVLFEGLMQGLRRRKRGLLTGGEVMSRSGWPRMGQFVTILLLAALASACSPSDSPASEALVYAMTACGIKLDESNRPVRDESGQVVQLYSGDLPEFDVDMGRLTDFEKRVSTLKSLTGSANAAAQLDQAWQPLASSMSQRLGFEERWLKIRKEGKAPSFVIPELGEQIVSVNALMSEWNSICGGLAERLSQ